MAKNDPPQSPYETLLSNRWCTIERLDADVLKCVTGVRANTRSLFVIGIVLVYGSIALIAWHLPAGRLNPVTLIGGVVALALGLFIQWRGMRRQKETGSYLIDRNERVIRDMERGSEYAFEAVANVRFTSVLSRSKRFDAFPGIPSRLFIHTRDGRKFVIGRGNKEGLERVVDWLVASGLTVSTDG